MASVGAVKDEYELSLDTGAVDPEKALPEFLEKLEVCRDLFHGFDYKGFFTGDDLLLFETLFHFWGLILNQEAPTHLFENR